jgi:FkbM family methyltransferase
VRQSKLLTRLLRLPAVLPSSPIRARLYRSISWPVAQRLRSETDVAVAGGSRMRVRTDDLVGRVLAISGEYEPNVTAAFRAALEPGDVCLDIGAHIGYYTVLAAKALGSAGRVYAFEPSPTSYRRLLANAQLNGFENITAVELAVGEDEGSAVLYEVPGQNSGMATLHPALAAKSALPAREVVVAVGPLTSVVPEADLRRVRVIKIDVEWHELPVLRSLSPVFDFGAPLSVFVEWTPRQSAPEAADQMRSFCQRYGFTVYGLGSGHSLDRLFPSRVDEPVPLDELPHEQTDLLLVR